MYMEWLQIKQVRNLESVQLSPGPRLNFLIGKNASGKTAILEAIFLLSRGRSFRTPKIQDVIQHNQKTLLVYARLQHEQEGGVSTALEKGYGQTSIRYNGNKVSVVSEQSRGVPVVLVTQDSQTLVTGSPKERRHWLDWAMFHVEQGYLENWKVYMRALRQRNVLLKKGINQRELYRAWEQAMVESGGYLTRTRQRFLNELLEAVWLLSKEIFSEQTMIRLSTDWPEPRPESDIYAETWDTDLKSGYTHVGSHNVDVKIQLKNKNMSETYSRGQIKLFVCLLMMAQAKVLADRTGIKPIVLIDDYMAELDNDACKYLLMSLASSPFQVFLSNTEPQNCFKNKEIYKMFHVERGEISDYQNT